MGSIDTSSSRFLHSAFVCAAALTLSLGCTTEMHYHESVDASVQAPPTGSGSDTSTGTTTSQYLECPDGWQANSTGDGCAPICAAGTELNESENGCVPRESEPGDVVITEDVGSPPPPDTTTPPDTTAPGPDPVECPAGYEEAEVDGVTVCVVSTTITIHGYVIDADTGLGIEGATVTANALGADPIVTDATGYFESEGISQVGQIALYYAAEGYHGAYHWVSVQSASEYGASEVFIDATKTLEVVSEESIETPPVADGWISGTVYAGDTPAEGATVRLRYASTGAEAGSAQTDANGGFMIDEVVADGHTFDLLVDNYDLDGDGGFDYQGQSIFVGAINEGGASAVNASNVVVVLSAFSKSLSYVNFTPPLLDVSGPGLYDTLQFGLADGHLIFHFGSETQPESLIVSLAERVAGVVVGTMDVAASWNDSGTVLTLDPAQTLTQDADPTTDYELRIEALLWSDGSAFVPLDAGVAGAARFQFQVGEAPTYLFNPIPTIYTDNLGTDDQDVALVSCDSRVCWLLDADGFPIGGAVDPSSGIDALGHLNSNDGFQLTWAPVAGASEYKIYARQSYNGPEASALQGWVELTPSSVVTGTFSASAATTVYAIVITDDT